MNSATPNRIRLLAAAEDLLLSKGYPATRIDEICEKSGVTKGGFYYHFESKDALVHALIERYGEHVSSVLLAGRDTGVEDPRERVLAFLDHAVEAAGGPLLKHGCVLGSCALDYSEVNPALRREIAAQFDGLSALLAGDLAAALDRSPVPGLDAVVLAQQFLAVLEGSIVMAKAYAEPQLTATGLRCFRVMLGRLFDERS